RAPKVLGYLKIPGFTRYLHPYDENYVIGIGRDENNNLRISIFDVSNTANPIEVSSYVIKGECVDTLALSDHKAFLFDKQKEIMAMPVSIIDGLRWQGAYIFRITLDHRIDLKGRISHQEESGRQDPSRWVKRTLYIDDVIYTVSEAKVRMNKLGDITLIGDINLS
ncbi:MAG: beta-propeller domain-containing protein, partial [Candidatus Bathyarchaeia archaeon]